MVETGPVVFKEKIFVTKLQKISNFIDSHSGSTKRDLIRDKLLEAEIRPDNVVDSTLVGTQK